MSCPSAPLHPNGFLLDLLQYWGRVKRSIADVASAATAFLDPTAARPAAAPNVVSLVLSWKPMLLTDEAGRCLARKLFYLHLSEVFQKFFK